MTTDDASTASTETAGAAPPPDAPPPPHTAPPPEAVAVPERHRGRSIIATVLGILAVIVLTLTTAVVWARAIVLRPDPIADLVADAISEPEVQQGLATYLASAAADAADLEARLKTALPAQLTRFAPTIAAGATAAAERVVERVIATPQFQEVVHTLVKRAHARAMQLLQGDGLADGITVSNGKVTLNTLPLMTGALTALQSATGLFSDVKIPQFTADGDPKQQIDELSKAVGRDLPDDLGQITVYQSDSVAKAQESVKDAQRVFALAKRAVWLLVILSVVLVAATILVAPRRLRAVLVLALGTVAAMVLLRSSLRTVVDQAPDLASEPGAKAAISSIFGGAAQKLQRLAGVVLLVAVVAAVVTLLVRRWRRSDLILSAAVVLGAITAAAVGVGTWGLIAGLIVGIAVPFVARWVLSSFGPRPEPPAATATEAAATPPVRHDATVLILGILGFGLLVGAAAQLILGRRGRGIDWGMALVAGLVGSFVGGLLFSLLAGDGLAFKPSGIIGSIVGALIVTAIWRAVAARRTPPPAATHGGGGGKATSRARR